MNHQIILKKGLWVLVAVGIIQVIAQEIGLYWIYPNLDIPMHFFGGVWLGLLSTWAVSRFGLAKGKFSFTYLFFVGFLTLLIGSGWEFFEYCIDGWLSAGMQLGLIDTRLDLIMDLLGAYSVALILLISKAVKYDHVSER